MSDALRSALTESLRHAGAGAGASGAAPRRVFASGCYGHCIQDSESYFTLRLREGPGAGLSLNDTVEGWLTDLLGTRHRSALPSGALIEQCWCGALNCSSGCPARTLWVGAAFALIWVFALTVLVCCIGRCLAPSMARRCCDRIRPLLMGITTFSYVGFTWRRGLGAACGPVDDDESSSDSDDWASISPTRSKRRTVVLVDEAAPLRRSGCDATVLSNPNPGLKPSMSTGLLESTLPPFFDYQPDCINKPPRLFV